MSEMYVASDASFRDLEQTAHLLASGFEFLLAEVANLSKGEQYLKRKLNFAYNEVRGLHLLQWLLIT